MILTRNGGKLNLLSQLMSRIEIDVGFNSMGGKKNKSKYELRTGNAAMISLLLYITTNTNIKAPCR